LEILKALHIRREKRNTGGINLPEDLRLVWGDMIFPKNLKGQKMKLRKNLKTHFKQSVTDKIIQEIKEAHDAKVEIDYISLSQDEWVYFCRELNSILTTELSVQLVAKYKVSNFSTEYVVPEVVLKLWKVITNQEIRIKKE